MSYEPANSPSRRTYHRVVNGYRSPHLQSLTSAKDRSPGPTLFDGLSVGLRQLRRIGGEVVATLRSAGSPLEASIRRLAQSPENRKLVNLFDLFDITEELPAGGAPYGLSFGGMPLLFDYCDPSLAVVQITGGRNSGKSHLLRSLAYSLALTTRQSQLQLLAISPAYGREDFDERDRQVRDPLAALDYLPHMLAPVNYEQEDAAEILSLLADEFDYRADKGIELPYITLIADDLDLLIEDGGPAIREPLARLLEVGPPFGFRLLTAVEHPAPPALDQLIGQEVGLRLVGRLEPAEEHDDHKGISGTQAEYYLEAGEFVAVSPGVVTPFQAGYLDAIDARIAAEVLQRPTGRVLLAQAWPEMDGDSRAIDGHSFLDEAPDSPEVSEEITASQTAGIEYEEDRLAHSGSAEDRGPAPEGTAGSSGQNAADKSQYERWNEEQIDPDDWLDDEPLPFDPDD